MEWRAGRGACRCSQSLTLPFSSSGRKPELKLPEFRLRRGQGVLSNAYSPEKPLNARWAVEQGSRHVSERQAGGVTHVYIGILDPLHFSCIPRNTFITNVLQNDSYNSSLRKNYFSCIFTLKTCIIINYCMYCITGFLSLTWGVIRQREIRHPSIQPAFHIVLYSFMWF